jgi:hypothetical protein
MCQLGCPKVIIKLGSVRWLKICFSDVRASFQLACFTFIRMDGSGENNDIWGSCKGRWFKKSRLFFYEVWDTARPIFLILS